MSECPFEERAALLKALAHPLRLKLVRGLLRCGCRNVRCMEEQTGQSQSCISPAPGQAEGSRGGPGGAQRE